MPELLYHPQLHQLHPLADVGEDRALRRKGGDADLLPQRRSPNGPDPAPVLVVPGVVGEQIGGPKDAQLLQLGPAGPTPGKSVTGVSGVMVMRLPLPFFHAAWPGLSAGQDVPILPQRGGKKQRKWKRPLLP